MKCLYCSFYDKNDSVNAFGTCEPQGKDYHCTHECNLKKDEIRELEDMMGYARQQVIRTWGK